MSAVFSPCGEYRYLLERGGDLASSRGPAVFVMLNPSTADASSDDPTIRRCQNFARAWGRRGIIVVNLYALRSTDPRNLWNDPDPVGPDNDAWLAKVAGQRGEVVCAWGAHAKPERVQRVVDLLTDVEARMLCLGTTKDGAPRHPLYVRGDQPLIEWTIK